MSFEWADFLLVARELDGEPTYPAPPESRKRSAIGRAYYASRGVAQTYADTRVTGGQAKPYREFDHGDLWRWFLAQDEVSLREVGVMLKDLYSMRQAADYRFDSPGIEKKSRQAILLAQEIIGSLAAPQQAG